MVDTRESLPSLIKDLYRYSIPSQLECAKYVSTTSEYLQMPSSACSTASVHSSSIYSSAMAARRFQSRVVEEYSQNNSTKRVYK